MGRVGPCGGLEGCRTYMTGRTHRTDRTGRVRRAHRTDRTGRVRRAARGADRVGCSPRPPHRMVKRGGMG
ncbi:hypothetical protein EKK70_07160 [Desulfovibrio sp. DS-1]|nr:hypothetical protein EKK70_07160 [Desulfovibrio sp. DS-1]